MHILTEFYNLGKLGIRAGETEIPVKVFFLGNNMLEIHNSAGCSRSSIDSSLGSVKVIQTFIFGTREIKPGNSRRQPPWLMSLIVPLISLFSVPMRAHNLQFHFYSWMHPQLARFNISRIVNAYDLVDQITVRTCF